MGDSHANTADSPLSKSQSRPDSTSTEHIHYTLGDLADLYTEVLALLESFLRLSREDQLFLGDSDLILFKAVNETWLKVRTWGHDIDQEQTEILQKLPELAKPLAEDVFAQLNLIWTPLENLDEQLYQKTNRISSEEANRLVETVAKAATKLVCLAEPIMDLQESRSDDKLRQFVERTVEERAALAKVARVEEALESGPAPIKIPKVQGPTSDESPSAATKREILTSLLRTVRNRPFIPISKDEVRLATIHPGIRKDPLRCSIFVVPVTELPRYEYEAVSYCWPEAGKSFIWTTVFTQEEGVIQIYDPEASPLRSLPLLPVSTKEQVVRRDTKHKNIITTELGVSSVVFEALDALRKEDAKVTVWVDAICLDLQDQEEKRVQSLNFSEIFFQATSVTHYLSTSSGLVDFGKQFDAVSRVIGSFDTESGASSKRRGRPDTQYEELIRLMNNKSFSRRWVVQEFVLARNVTLRAGGRTLAWSKFADAMRLWQRLVSCYRPRLGKEILCRAGVKGTKRTVTPAERILEAMERMSRKESTNHVIRSPFTLQYLVTEFSTYEFASNSPRDAIGAFLSIATDVAKYSPPKDTSKPRKVYLDRGIQFTDLWTASTELSTLAMFVNFVEHCIQETTSLDIICSPWAPSDSGPLPSWIKSRPHKRSMDQTILNFTGESSHYQAADSTKPIFRFASPDPSLRNLQPSGLQASDDPTSIDYDPKIRFQNIVKEAMRAKRLETNPKIQERQILFAKGLLLGHIEEVSARIVGGVITRECLELGGIFVSEQDRWNPEDIPPTLWRTLVADTTPTGAKAPGIYQRIMSYSLNNSMDGDIYPRRIRRPGMLNRSTRRSTYAERAEHSENSSDDSSDDEERTGKEVGNILNEFLNQVEDVTHNRKLFRARNDELFGLAPAAAAVGDAVCILFGCSVPVILRNRLSEGASGANPYYELVDECYVDGIMAGEAIIELEKEDLEARTVEFEIR